jgi:ubiquinone/menaquinone biosynthesis C-methylase UbiE
MARMIERKLEPEVMDTAGEAAAYDAMDHREPNAAFVRRLVELGAHGDMLDIGTGPGHIPILLCDAIADCRIVAIDLSKHMLAHARQHLAASPHGGRVTYQFADAKGLPFDDASFDCVFSNTILHHIPDPRPFIAEAYRVLRPNGALLIRDLFRPDSEAALAHLVDTYAAGQTPEQRQLFADSLRAALTPDELRDLLASLGLDGVEVVVDTDRHVSIQQKAR